MNLNSSRQFVKKILPRVSRTFALNIRILKSVEYDFVGSTYLICRFIDTIEDSYLLKSSKKVILLNKFAKIFNPPICTPDSFSKLIKEAQNISDNPSENELIRCFGEVIFLYNSLPKVYHQISTDMIREMALGMSNFIKKYSKNNKKILQNDQEMELYCHYVAGTVGIILTRLFCLKISSPTTKQILNKYTKDFSLALQMTNIVKDFSDDKKRGWSYIPKTILKEANITVNQYYKNLKPQQVKVIQGILIKKVEFSIDNSLKYCLNIPVKLYKYRLFCLIPLFLATKTIFFLKNRHASQIHSKKISKKSLFLTISIIYMISNFNFLIKFYYSLIKKNK